jgi:hypothetical protein
MVVSASTLSSYALKYPAIAFSRQAAAASPSRGATSGGDSNLIPAVNAASGTEASPR